jgi:hypothetical protein
MEKYRPLWRMPSGTWKLNTTGSAMMSSGKSMDILWAVECWERAEARVINLRMKKRCMRRKLAHATSVVALRVQHINAEWDAAA